jgi:hypothetical protein
MVFDIAMNDVDVDEIELIYDREAEYKIKCICGAILNKQDITNHDNSIRHINYLDMLLGRYININQKTIELFRHQ